MKNVLPKLPESVVAARFPSWAVGEKNMRMCPVCDRLEFDYLCTRPDLLDVVQCQCGMIFVQSVPIKEEVDKFYDEYATFKKYTPPHYSWYLKQKLVRSDPFITILKNSGGLRDRKLLEVGCSYGAFLTLARHSGAKTSGVEVDIKAREHAINSGFSVSETINTTVNYDIVCAIQVLEHLVNPKPLIHDVASVLPEDGRFLISVPNAGEVVKIGTDWVGFRLDFEHCNFFDIRSLAALLKTNGLYIEQYWEHYQPSLQRHGEKNQIEKSGGFVDMLSSFFMTRNNYKVDFSSSGTFVLTALARKVCL